MKPPLTLALIPALLAGQVRLPHHPRQGEGQLNIIGLGRQLRERGETDKNMTG